MGIFDTPKIVNENLLKLKNLSPDNFTIDVKILQNGSFFHIIHDYFDSPCYFKILSWEQVNKETFFVVERYPKDENQPRIIKEHFSVFNINLVLDNWQLSVSKMLDYENLYTDPSIENLKKELILKLGLTDENANKLLDETQKLHAYQYCDQICEILDELEGKEYDENKIREIRFDLEKIKRDIENLKIKTTGELANGIVKAWSKVRLAKISQYITNKIGDGMASKLIDGFINMMSE